MTTVKKPKQKAQKSLHLLHPRRVKGAISHRYYYYMPNKKHHRVLIWVAFLSYAVIVATQLLYPPDRALPLAQLHNTRVGWATHETMAKMIADRFDASKINLTIGNDRSKEYALKSTGAVPNTEAMIAQLSNYPFWQRYIPFSIFWQPTYVNNMDISYSDAVLKEFSQVASKDLSFEPINAHLAIKDGALVATGDTSGSVVTPQSVSLWLRKTALPLGSKVTKITVPSDRREAAMTMQDLAAVRTQAEAALARPIRITASSQTFSPDRATIASWLVIGANEAGVATLTVDPARLGTYLEEINTKVGTPAGQTNISMVNGRETGRTPGSVGKGINRDLLISQVSESLLRKRGGTTFAVQFVDVQPSIIYNNKYTATQEGLQTYVNDVGRTRNIRISIQQLDGGKWTANARATESTPSASTFKLYIALMLFDKMDKGEIRWSDPMLDTTVSGCFNRMTIASTNPCAEKWIADWGKGNINNFVYAHGFSQGTAFIYGDAVHTTAADLTRYMIGLYDGSLVKGAYRDRLLYSLASHPYQDGIPAGSAGIVHNKVGFLWDYVHDSAIVQHPRGTYVMTVMTKGYSYATIATITREVERIMYP